VRLQGGRRFGTPDGHNAVRANVHATHRGGFLGDAGIASERYSIYLQSLPRHADEARHHMSEAIVSIIPSGEPLERYDC
jgi:hypothetical protein